MRIRPSTFVSITSRSSSSSDSQTGSRPRDEARVVDEDVEPAELSHRALDELFAASAGSVTSSVPSRREPVTTRAPASASALAVAAPIPLDPPVTIARLPSRPAMRGNLAPRVPSDPHQRNRLRGV